MRLCIFSVFIALVVNVGCSTSSRTKIDDKFYSLQEQLGKSYQMHSSEKGTEIRYCPDNTCDVILGPNGLSDNVLADFAFLFLSRHSTYTTIKDFQKSIAEKQISEIVKKYNYLCSEKLLTSKCVLMGIKNKFSIKLMFSRFDEGEESFSQMNLD